MLEAILLSFCSAAGFAVGNVFIRAGTQRIPGPTATTFAVITSSLVAFIPALIGHASEITTLSWRAYAWFALMGAMSYPGARVLNNTAISMVGASGAGPFASLQPVFAFILGMAVLNERPDLLIILGTPTIVCGLILVIRSRSNPSSGAVTRPPSSPTSRVATRRNSLGYLMAAGAAATFGTRDTISRHVVTSLAPFSVTAALSLSMGAVMILAFTFRGVISSMRDVPIRYAIFCSCAGIAQGLALVSLFGALHYAPVTTVSPINASSPLITLLLAHIFLQRLESVNLLLAFGTILSVCGVILVIFGASG